MEVFSLAEVQAATTMDKIVSLAKRRGFIFQSSEIYGGLNSCWDYGPLGVELKNNVKRAWWRKVVQERDDMVGQDASILMHPRVWEASGHVAGFTDPMVDCKSCKQRFRADHLEGDKCPACGGSPPVQLDVQNFYGAGGGQRGGCFSKTRNRPGDFRQF